MKRYRSSESPTQLRLTADLVPARSCGWLTPRVRRAYHRSFARTSRSEILIVRRIETRQLIRVGHSPDPDDAFMFHALTNDCVDTGRYMFTHELVDIETLNQRAFRSELELTALSIHAYAFLHDRYALCNCGASMGDGYGPMVVAQRGLFARRSEGQGDCRAR